MKSWQTLKLNRDDRGVLTIALHRPEVRNAFNDVLIRELSEVATSEAAAPETRVIIFKGEGPLFCAGGDLNWMRRSIELDYAENLKDTRVLTQMFQLLNECPKPIIGAIHGAAIGGGVGLVSICDYVIATQDTQFSLSEVRLGIVPACIGPFVVAKIGASHARGLFVSAERFLAPRAQQIGLVHEVVADTAALAQAADRIASNIVQCSPNAVTVAKRLVLDLTWPERRAELPNAQGGSYEYVSKVLADLRISDEGQEGIRAFLEKRPPAWISEVSEVSEVSKAKTPAGKSSS